MRKINKSASIMHEVIIHLVLVGIIFAMFFAAAGAKASSRVVKQQVVEKELALLIDSAVPGMEFIVYENNMKGSIDKIEIKENRVFAYVDSLTYSEGYQYFTKYNVVLEKIEGGFKIKIR